MKVFEGDKYIDVEIQEYEKFRITKDCFKGKAPKCDAFAATRKKAFQRLPQSELSGHPAVRNCHEKGGISRILITKDNKQYDYCRFDDGSMIDAWDLYDNDPSK
jgi:hypothetical protein